jgi:hypothetical protein
MDGGRGAYETIMNQNRTDPELLSFGKKKPDPFVGFQSFGLGEGLSGHFV